MSNVTIKQGFKWYVGFADVDSADADIVSSPENGFAMSEPLVLVLALTAFTMAVVCFLVMWVFAPKVSTTDQSTVNCMDWYMYACWQSFVIEKIRFRFSPWMFFNVVILFVSLSSHFLSHACLMPVVYWVSSKVTFVLFIGEGPVYEQDRWCINKRF